MEIIVWPYWHGIVVSSVPIGVESRSLTMENEIYIKV